MAWPKKVEFQRRLERLRLMESCVGGCECVGVDGGAFLCARMAEVKDQPRLRWGHRKAHQTPWPKFENQVPVAKDRLWKRHQVAPPQPLDRVPRWKPVGMAGLYWLVFLLILLNQEVEA